MIMLTLFMCLFVSSSFDSMFLSGIIISFFTPDDVYSFLNASFLILTFLSFLPSPMVRVDDDEIWLLSNQGYFPSLSLYPTKVTKFW